MEWNNKNIITVKLTDKERKTLTKAYDIIDEIYQGLWKDGCDDQWKCDVWYGSLNGSGTEASYQDELNFAGVFGLLEILYRAKKIDLYL